MTNPDNRWFRIEYQTRTDGMFHNLRAQQAMLNYAFLLAGGAGGLLGAAFSAGSGELYEWVWPVLLILGGIMALLVLYYIRHDLLIAYGAQYVEENIRLKDPTLPNGALTWEKKVMKHRSSAACENTLDGLLHKVLAFARFAPILVLSVAIFGLGIWALATQLLSALVFWASLAMEAVYLTLLLVVVWAVAADYRENEKIAFLSQLERPKASALESGAAEDV